MSHNVELMHLGCITLGFVLHCQIYIFRHVHMLGYVGSVSIWVPNVWRS